MFRKNKTSSPKSKRSIRKQLTLTASLLAGMAALWALGKNEDRKLKRDLENFTGN